MFIQGYASDSLHVSSFNTFRMIRNGNSWLETGNAAGLVFNQPFNKVNVETGLDHAAGDFHRIREGKLINDYAFSTESYQAQKNRLFVYGKFAYHYRDESGGQWNGTYDPYSGNPYILADSVSGVNYHKENYNLVGGIGYILNEKISIGGSIDYYAGVAAKQKDPRPQNIYVRFKINPALILTADHYKLGIDAGYSNRKEEIEYDVFRSNFSPTYFAFKGFGFYSKEIGTGYNRFVSANEFFGGLQLEKKFGLLPTLTELRFNYNVEVTEDGSSVIRKLDGGDWHTYSVVLKEQINLRNALNRHIFRANFSFFNGDGNEFLQNIVYEGTWNVPRYITIGENLKFNRQTLNGNLSYNYLRMKDEGNVDWDTKATINFLNNSEQYFYIPEIFTAGYTNIAGELNLQKNLYFGKCHLALALNSCYTMNLSKDMQLSALPEITKKQRKDVYQQEFDFYSSSLFKAGGEIKVGGNLLRSKHKSQAFLSLCYDHLKQIDGIQSFNLISTKLGFVF
jgi:hypothetical protein